MVCAKPKKGKSRISVDSTPFDSMSIDSLSISLHMTVHLFDGDRRRRLENNKAIIETINQKYRKTRERMRL
jgi:hypothetical protein